MKMEHKDRFGLYVGKPVDEYHILAILPKKQDLRVDCVVSDGNIWSFNISDRFPDLKIGVVRTLVDGQRKWEGYWIAYYTTIDRETQKVEI